MSCLKRKSSLNLINRLDDVKLNITAITIEGQIIDLITKSFFRNGIVSYFAGRVADTGDNPLEVVKRIKEIIKYNKGIEILWASPREVLNIYQAEEAGADIITCTPELLEKYEKMKGKDLNELSLETVKMFFNDAQAAGYKL